MKFYTEKQKQKAEEIKDKFSNLNEREKRISKINFCTERFRRELVNLSFSEKKFEDKEKKIAYFVIEVLLENRFSFIDMCLILSYVSKRMEEPTISYCTMFDSEKLKLEFLIDDGEKIKVADEIVSAFFEEDEFFDVDHNTVFDFIHSYLKIRMYNSRLY